MANELAEEIVDKDQYHIDDDDFLSAPGSSSKNRSPKHNTNAQSPPEYPDTSPTDEEETKHNEVPKKTSIIMKLEKRNSIPYNLSDDTSDTSDDDDDDAPIDRKYTTQSHTVDSSNFNLTPPHKSASTKQYTILLNDKSFLHDPNGYSFPSNYIKTSKYTLLTFIPLNLFEQFRRIANIYFLMIIGVQLIPGVSPFPIETSIMPLAFILCVGAIKDGIEDYDRHKSDRIANSRSVLKLCHDASNLVGAGGEFGATISCLLEPSDMILIKRNEVVPADCVVLGVVDDDCPDSSSSGVCYINTSSMDGENAPKLRRALERTHSILEGSDLCQLRGSLKCPVNNKSLHGFTGCLSIKKSTIPVVTKQKTTEKTTENKSRNSVKRLTLNKIEIFEELDDDDEDDEEEEVVDDYLTAKIVDKVEEVVDRVVIRGDEDAMSGLSDINFIFRGSKLVNTQSIIALVVFVGRETKLMLNRNEVPFKFSKFESTLNQMILSILIFNFILCVLFAILANLVEEPFVELRRDSWFDGFLLDFCSWLILTSWMIPFSLYVTLELVKMICSQWVAWDDKMTYDTTTTGGNNAHTSAWDEEYGGKVRRAKTKNSNLNEELGHIDYIFTDKTGTLTQNQMELSKCSVMGHKYITNIGHTVGSNDYSSFGSLCGNVIRHQHAKKNKEEAEDVASHNESHFVLNLLLCSSTLPLKRSELDKLPPPVMNHDNNETLVSSQSQPQIREEEDEAAAQIEFQSPSPDEVAFAEALCSFGVELAERQADGTLVLRLSDGISSFCIKFRVLATLDFTARRKRMTVIVLDEFGGIHLYCKGADTTLFALCGKKEDEEKEKKKKRKHLTKRHLTSFARDGSRTLVIAYRSLSMEEYDEFDSSYREACIALGDNRGELIESAFAYVEHSLHLLGCTAVEDQMQEGVPQAIDKLAEAQIKVIMLTGDKQETAVSIGRQSHMIQSDSKLMFLSANSKQNMDKQQRKVDKKVDKFLSQIEAEAENEAQANALILNGDALEMCLHPLIIDSFMLLFWRVSTIICCRCNPSQKAMLVGAVKSHLNGVALAIGDGANDVSMIQSANVGIGLMGKEGTQASLAADFVIHRFSHCVRLLFVHGRYSFLRTSTVSLISLYKNMAFMLTVCYYGVYSLYTASSCFDPWLMSGFNLLFAAAFPLCVGAFEQDIDQESCIAHPRAYYAFHRTTSTRLLRTFACWMWTACWQSATWFAIAVLVYNDNQDIWNHKTGQNGGVFVWSTQIFTANVVIICLKMMCETYHWNWTYFVSTAASIAIYCITALVLSNWMQLDPDMFAVFPQTKNEVRNWLIFIVQCVLCLFPGILLNLWKRERSASLAQVLYEAIKFGYDKKYINGDNNNATIHRSTDEIIQDYLSR
eukprot:22688_1